MGTLTGQRHAVIQGDCILINILVRIDTREKIAQDAIGKVTGGIVMHVTLEKQRDILPETLQSSQEILENLLGLLTFLAVLSKTLGTMTATVSGQHLIGYLVIILQMGIGLDNLIPDSSLTFHQLHDTLPLLWIALAQGLCPYMGVLVERNIRACLLGIQKDSTTIDEAIDLGIVTLQSLVLLWELLQDILGSIPVGRDLQAVMTELVNQGIDHTVTRLSTVIDFEVPVVTRRNLGMSGTQQTGSLLLDGTPCRKQYLIGREIGQRRSGNERT